MFAYSDDEFNAAEAIYDQMFRAASTVIADVEIASELFASICNAHETMLEESGMTGDEIHEAMSAFCAADSASDFIGFPCYEVCSYKGESEGYMLAMNASHLPVFNGR